MINSITLAKCIWYSNRVGSYAAFNMIIKICAYWHEKNAHGLLLSRKKAGNQIHSILFYRQCAHMWERGHVTMTVFLDAPQHAAVLLLRDWSWLRNFSLCFWKVSEFIVTSVSWTYKKSNLYIFTFIETCSLLSIVIKLCLIRISPKIYFHSKGS